MRRDVQQEHFDALESLHSQSQSPFALHSRRNSVLTPGLDLLNALAIVGEP